MSCQNDNLKEDVGNSKQNFLITTGILEGRHYAWPNMDSVVTVQALGKKETTAVVHNSDNPYYNEFFTFDKKTTLDKILDNEITITVIQPRTVFRRRKILGYFKLDVATVWEEPGHQFFNKWAILSAPPNKFVSGSRGFLKVNLALITKNISPTIPQIQNTDEIEGNLLLPHSKIVGRYRAMFEFRIYRAEHFYDKNKAPSSYVEVSFAGNIGKTAIKKKSSFPTYNEKIVLWDLFPPLCQRFHINIYFGSSLAISDSLTLSYLTTDDDDDGYLPSFGPSFLHFYEKKNMERYQGSLFLSLRTKLDMRSMEDKKNSHTLPIGGYSEYLFSYVTLRFFAVLFESSSLDKRFDGNVQFKIAIGKENTDEEADRSDSNMNSIVSDKIKIVKINRNSSYMMIKEKKPLLCLTSTVIDYRKRLYILNMQEKIARAMEKKLETIGNFFAMDDISLNMKISKSLQECIDNFNSSAKKFLDIAGNYKFQNFTELDKSKFGNNLKQMENILKKTETIFNPNSLRRTFLKMKKFSDRLICLSKGINDIWPDAFINVWKENKKIAYIRLSCKDILYSPIEEEKGKLCGLRSTLFLQAEKKKYPRAKNVTNMVGKVEILLWLGAEKFVPEFMKNLPTGFEEMTEPSSSFRYLSTNEVHIFQCRCHLFQGRVKPGYDESTLSDTMVRIHFWDDCQESTIEQQTLNPVWNQTLIFKRIITYGPIPFIQTNPPSIIIEVLDRDKFFFWDYIGRTSLKPLVKSKEEPYAPPRFPPKLKWIELYNAEGVGAEVLGAFEMLEISGRRKQKRRK
ncbi:hypothetical protein HHI36_018537 [Cryptolaemus montrouzieri]|uniref:C2 domain-containing protein n=1 Tax=Cryptolaemus montrouzieri TaxID=559131 RepID=A0ABD2P0E0_9CUCU